MERVRNGRAPYSFTDHFLEFLLHDEGILRRVVKVAGTCQDPHIDRIPAQNLRGQAVHQFILTGLKRLDRDLNPIQDSLCSSNLIEHFPPKKKLPSLMRKLNHLWI